MTYQLSPGKRRFTWPEVVRAVQCLETRSRVVRRLADSGFSLDSFGAKTEALRLVADELTQREDELELKHGQRAAEERARVRVLRRAIEDRLG